MGVILHGVAHDVGHFVESPVVKGVHGVEYASLHGFQSVVDMRYGTLEDYVGCIFEKPALVHASQLVAYNVVGRVEGDTSRRSAVVFALLQGGIFEIRVVQIVRSGYIVAHMVFVMIGTDCV